jgi:hypothetical protein
MVAGFGEERGVVALTRGDGGRVWTAAVVHAAFDQEESGGGQSCRKCPFFTGHSVTEGRRPGWLNGMRYVAAQRWTGGPHVPAKFQFLEIPKNRFLHNKNR